LITQIDIENLHEKKGEAPIIDVRSPAEYALGHIPGAVNIPILDDQDRAIVGITYKQKSKELAIQLALELFEPKKADFLNGLSELKCNEPVVHCWRGGMRSAEFAEFASKNGYNPFIITGGYKAYRQLMHGEFSKQRKILILGGMTGTGKTDILKKLNRQGYQTIDIEGIAHHKGSAFGALGQEIQPTTEQFQNNIWEQWQHLNMEEPVIIEDESQAIGTVRIPDPLYANMRKAPVLKLELGFEFRIDNLVGEYTTFGSDILEPIVHKIRKRLGGQNLNKAVDALKNGDMKSFVEIVLKYYDKAYNFGLSNRDSETIFPIELFGNDAGVHAEGVNQFIQENESKIWKRSNSPNTATVPVAGVK